MDRESNREQFVTMAVKEKNVVIKAITSDASFRQYFRVTTGLHSYVLMDSPPDKIDNTPFIELNQAFAKQALNVPKIIATDKVSGLLLLEDLGAEHLADRLLLSSKIDDYKALLSLLPAVAKTPQSPWMKPYDSDFIQAEMTIFQQWLVSDWLGIRLSQSQQAQWTKTTEALTKAMLAQPQVTMHRDFHSRNLIFHDKRWYLIDYQDAVVGPVTYDTVSLLRDCYTRLSVSEYTELVAYSFSLLSREGLLAGMSQEQFCYYVDLTGMQRHLKAAGIFVRLLLRDGKQGYLGNIIPTLRYVHEVACQYEDFQWLASWVGNEIIPSVKQKLALG
ncbi:aminoglycoside phosphotransferase family protein [Pseudoalteromonas sp. T1lg65]|uniref:aminoglycoside phosphotransferase family protein n=1 Tax=Pseudoalteromonas sp. T1lg65 TaxID=2077101 RepID=UPI003F7A6AFE